MAAAKPPADSPLDRVKSLLADLSDAVDALDTEESGEGETAAETEEASTASAAPSPNVAAALPWRKTKPAKTSAK